MCRKGNSPITTYWSNYFRISKSSLTVELKMHETHTTGNRCFNRPMSIKEIESIINNLPKQKASSPDVFKHLRKKFNRCSKISFRDFKWYHISVFLCLTYFTLKSNELSSHERHGGTLNAYYYLKGANLKRLHTLWHSGKDKTVETIKRSVVASGWGWEVEDEKVENREFLGQWKYSLYYNNRHMALYICWNHRMCNTKSEP